MQFTPRPGDPAPRRIRRIGRLVAILGVAVIFIALLWVFTGIPSPVAVDSGLADGYVLRPRTRFERAITCGSERRRRAAAPR
jgi:hypothetical protein